MKIQNVSVSEIVPYEFNNKIHDEDQVNKIANSIKEFGFTQPIVLDKNNVIVAGHGRREASKKIGMDEVPVTYVSDLSDVQLKKYRILDNKLSDIAKRDIENLKIELEDINDEELGELFDVFSFSDIEEVSEDFSQKNKEIDPDSIYGDEKTHICPKCHFEFLPK